jgi:hypothetical protein
MVKEVLIILLSWLVSIFLLFKYVPIESKRTAHITFLFSQAITWLYQYIQLVFGLLEFPFREFPTATKMSFSLPYIVYPTFGVFFIVLYPKEKKRFRIFIHYMFFAIAIPMVTFMIEKYSSIFYFNKWDFFTSVIIDLFILFIIKKFVFWFKKGTV